MNVGSPSTSSRLRVPPAITSEDQVHSKRGGHYGDAAVVTATERVGKIRAALEARRRSKRRLAN